MPTFVYNPGIQVYIETTDKKSRKKTILDVTEDVISGSVTRRVNGVSNFTLTLQNSGRKFDFPRPVFQPNDRVIINMKRISWVRVLTGYLNQVPLFSVWPGEITLTGSCTLKRLQYWTWDPNLTATYGLVSNALNQNPNSPDGGLKAAFMAVLDQVVGWDKRRVHIGSIPSDWFDLVLPIAKEVEKDAEAAGEYASQNAAAIGGEGTTGGITNQGPVQSTPTLEGMPIPATRGKVSEFGITSGPGADFTPTSTFANGKTITSSNPYFCAMRWDYPHPGTNFPYTSNAKPSDWFFGGGDPSQAKKVVITNTRTKKQVIAYAADYGPGQTSAELVYAIDVGPQVMDAMGGQTGDVVTIGWATNQNVTPGPVNGNEGYNTATTTADPQGTLTSTANPQNSRRADNQPAQATGKAFLEVAMNLVTQYPNIPYKLGGDSAYTTDASAVQFLDCSSFVQWTMYHTTGTMSPPGTSGSLGRTVGDQWAFAHANGMKQIPVETAMKIPGAIMVVLPNEHTEISMGDGLHTVGAHHTGTYCGVVQNTSWTCGYLMPGIEYRDSTGNIVTGPGYTGSLPPDQVYTNGALGNSVPATTSLIPTDALGSDPIDQLFNSSSFVALPSDTSGEIYSGAIGLMNDSTVFPYLDNLIKSSLRQWCSAPNGDIMAWFPDYYGVWGTGAKMYVEDIELQDFSVVWSDEALITHEYVVGALATTLDTSTGTVSNTANNPDLTTRGIASIDLKSMMASLFKMKPTAADEAAFRDYIYQRFGARVELQHMPGIYGPKAEFFMAVYYFMQRWSGQFTANVPLTFMPELWPGMLLILRHYGFQAYVQEVRHDFRLGKGGGFTTSATIVAPAEIGNNPLLSYLPQVQPYDPGAGPSESGRRDDALRNLPPQIAKQIREGRL